MVSNTACTDPCELFEAERNSVKALVDDFVTSLAEEAKSVYLQPTPKSKLLLSRKNSAGVFAMQKPS